MGHSGNVIQPKTSGVFKALGRRTQPVPGVFRRKTGRVQATGELVFSPVKLHLGNPVEVPEGVSPGFLSSVKVVVTFHKLI